MLLMLFLLFYLNSPYNGDSAGMETVNKGNLVTNEFIQNIQVATQVLSRIEEKDSLAYQDRDSIPIISPIKPIEIRLITSDYGLRKHPIYGDVRRHHGIDIAAPLGTNIYSTADGVVVKVKYSKKGYGNEVVIKHGHDYKTRYAHLEKINVVEGQIITKRDIIGALGNTGLTTGPHLHYEILNKDVDIDPMIFSYNDKKDRNIETYNSTLIALETI